MENQDEDFRSKFSYDELSKELKNAKFSMVVFTTESQLMCARQKGAFYHFSCISHDEKYQKKDNYGWKFHISIMNDLEDNTNLKRAWNIIRDIAIKHNIGVLKIVRDGLEMKGNQVGKEVTTYTWSDADKTPEQWIEIMSDITIALTQARIISGEPAISHEHKIEHSFDKNPFITYRYQKPNEDTLSEEDLAKIPEGDNPYKDVDMSYKACLERINRNTKESDLNEELNSNNEDSRANQRKL